METTTLFMLTGQVREHLKGLPAKDRIRELIYNHFLAQCKQYEIAEDEFYKLILKQAFRDAAPAPEEDPDPINRKGTSVKLFGVTLHSLKRLGQVLFEHVSQEKVYFEDVTFLKAHTDSLENADTAIEYTRLYQSESDPQKRYLRICYRLNPQLPYRIDGKLFDDLESLLAAGFESWPFMRKIYKDYENGKLNIWLQEHDPDKAVPVPADQRMISFLTLIYSVNPGFPFYVEQELFFSPIELIVKAQKNLDFWNALIKYCNNGVLFVWFDALGYTDWRIKLKQFSAAIQHDQLMNDQEKVYALIQELLYLIDPEAIRPCITASETKIEALQLEATQLIAVPVRINLKILGFTKVQFALTTTYEGLWLDKTHGTFFDLTGQREETVTLCVDPQKLQKNLLYQTNVVIISPYETLTIPVKIQSIFPLRAFLLYLFKYSAFGALLFGFFRWLLSAGIGQTNGLAAQLITTVVGRSLPDDYLTFYWVFVAMLTCIIISVVAIRKVEKI